MLRRGLVGAVASAAIVTNVSDDHLGEWGIETVEQMAHVKLLIRQGRLPNTPLFLNCDNSPLYTAATSLHETEGPLCWFSPEQHTPDSFSALPGSLVSWQAQGQLVFQLPGEDTHKLSLQDIPITMQVLAAFNICNVQAAVLAARQTGISWQAIEEALASFQPSVQDNPGRMNLFTLNDARFVIDFGHNPDGVAALADTVARLPRTGRRLVLIGQAGDRSDPEITGLGISALRCEPDLILIKELEPYLRGRQLGDIPRLIQHALKERGFEATHVEPSERDAVNWAINWAKPGDLVLLFIQASPQHAIQCLLDAGATEGWDA
jgi:UDP-N-acetylmuramyl tripeptide synthase